MQGRMDFTFAPLGHSPVLGSAEETCLFDAFVLLSWAMHGVSAASIPYSWIAEDADAKISLAISSAAYGELCYDITLRRAGLTTIVESEALHSNGRTFLSRRGSEYSIGERSSRCHVNPGSFVLFVATPFLQDDPVSDVRRQIQQLWVMMPDPNKMVSDVQNEQLPGIDIPMLRLATYIVLRQQSQPALYAAMIALTKETCQRMAGLSLERDTLGGRYLAVHYHDERDMRGIPFEYINPTEKMLLLSAFLRAVNEFVEPISVVWNYPENWLPGKAADMVLDGMRKSFATRGQLVLLSAARKDDMENRYVEKTLH